MHRYTAQACVGSDSLERRFNYQLGGEGKTVALKMYHWKQVHRDTVYCKTLDIGEFRKSATLSCVDQKWIPGHLIAQHAHCARG